MEHFIDFITPFVQQQDEELQDNPQVALRAIHAAVQLAMEQKELKKKTPKEKKSTKQVATCDHCGLVGAKVKCNSCKVMYCDNDCLKKNAKKHKATCK
jgi:predicted glycosyltransferase involved in capsule biosynthesis